MMYKILQTNKISIIAQQNDLLKPKIESIEPLIAVNKAVVSSSSSSSSY